MLTTDWLLLLEAGQPGFLSFSCSLPGQAGQPIKQPVGWLLLITGVIYCSLRAAGAAASHNIDLTLGCRPGTKLPTRLAARLPEDASQASALDSSQDGMGREGRHVPAYG